MTEDQWEDQLRPIPNPYTPGTGFDFGNGSYLMGHVDLQMYTEAHHPSPDRLWSIVEGDSGKLYISPGVHWVNVLGYIVTENVPALPVTEDILLDT